MTDSPLCAAIDAQIMGLPCRHYAMNAVVRMSSADRTAVRLERKNRGKEVPNGALHNYGALKIKRDDSLTAPLVVCQMAECREKEAE